ncbi:MAG: hypothetical protein PHF89_01825 [Eubacteriales bacterium]|nr:hypothetical protein [Eubacteriales bacterium]
MRQRTIKNAPTLSAVASTAICSAGVKSLIKSAPCEVCRGIDILML